MRRHQARQESNKPQKIWDRERGSDSQEAGDILGVIGRTHDVDDAVPSSSASTRCSGWRGCPY